jgi:hypothetical protein
VNYVPFEGVSTVVKRLLLPCRGRPDEWHLDLSKAFGHEAL